MFQLIFPHFSFVVNKKKKTGSNSRRKGIYRIYRTDICKRLVAPWRNFVRIQRIFPLPKVGVQIFTKELVFRTIVSRCCWTIVERQIMDNHGSIARSGNNDHEYFSLLHNASMARYSSSRVITAALRRIHVAIRTRRCASRAHRWIQHWNRSLETEHIRSLSPHITSPPHLFQNLSSSVNDDLFLFVSIHFVIDLKLLILLLTYEYENVNIFEKI